MAHKSFDALIAKLASDFGAAAKTMLNAVLAFARGHASAPDASSVIDAVASALHDETAQWVEQTLPQVYADGMQEALRGAQEPSSGLAMDHHDMTLQMYQDELLGRLALATANISEDAKNAIREAARRNLAQNLSGGVIKGAQDFAQEMTDSGLTFTDRSGKKWDPSAYADMVARTVSAEVLNAGHLNTAAEIGSTHVRVHDGKATSDEACRLADGQVWTIAYAATHPIEHPNCRRAFAAMPSTYNGEVDRG